jgi:hypothetical protein
MGFNVDPSEIRRFANELAVLEQSAGDAARQTRYTDPRATGISGDETFTEAVWDGVDRGLDAVLELDEDERARLSEEGNALFDGS